ncbi:MAG: hypothetical protein J3K34DRAFT_496570 [Monoraphidium minutum]|nr:MAG: hypothetical protein J3K34DRAFT_496570 [Monoraphidium minutum]
MCYLGFPSAADVAAPAAQGRPASLLLACGASLTISTSLYRLAAWLPRTQASKEQQQQQGEQPQLRQPSPYADEFMMWCFKASARGWSGGPRLPRQGQGVVECDNPQHTRDDWDACPFAHAGEVVTRRPPQTHLPKLCPKARRACRKGRACPYAHNVFEHWLHPSRFKTEICQHGGACARPMCFFAHYEHEVRSPSPSADEVMAAAEAAGLLGRAHGHGGGCGSSRCSGSCYEGSGTCSRRSSATNHDMGFGAAAAAPWLAQPSAAALAAALQQQAAPAPAPPPHPQQVFGAFSADLAFAAQCLQAQQRAQSAAAAAAAAAAAGWSGSDWSLLSSGGSTPTRLLPGAAGAAGVPAHGYGAPSPPLPPSAALGAGAFGLWSAPAPPRSGLAAPPAAPGGGAPLGGLSSEDAMCLLAGLGAPPAAPTAASSYLCALQAEQARVAAIAGFF